ncbi:MAG: division/cell wall cluster transcriptional repressor MraZ [Burkholderiales bacterium]|jgi:MraZ protein|nr:division/cell wall cluster transcriptional repressor MraZ [Burkholderiales bacterium]
MSDIPEHATLSPAKPGFRGVTLLSLDAKGRLAVPVRYRDALFGDEQKLVVTAGQGSFLMIYPRWIWQPKQDELMALPSFDDAVSDLQRRLVGYAEDVEPDSVGRILISPSLRDIAQLGRQVALVGLGTRFEVWDKSLWDERMEAAKTKFKKNTLPPSLEGFSL